MLRRPLLACILLAAAACGGGSESDGGDAGLTGEVRIDGSSTVFPVMEALAEEFQRANPEARVTVGRSGTGGGFQRFCGGEIDLSDASRPITAAERERCRDNGIDFLRVPMAVDGLSVVTNPANDFVECLSLEELRRIWRPDSDVTAWQDIRPEWPDREIKLYGPGTDSGTFDFFTEMVVGEAKASRTDYQASEDDNVLVRGVAGDPSSLGYFGYAFWVENQERLELLEVDAGEGCIRPSDETIGDGTYPLARPLYVYVKTASLQEPTVRRFVDFALESASQVVPATGYHPLQPERYQEALGRVEAVVSGGDAGGGAGPSTAADTTSASDG
jgi:phosphate transport system substrate-binding protein